LPRWSAQPGPVLPSSWTDFGNEASSVTRANCWMCIALCWALFSPTTCTRAS